jgi:hypothetical protein
MGVLQVNEDGQPMAGYTVRDHGLDGTASRRREIIDLPFARREELRQAYGLLSDLFHALATGEWSAEQADRFWSGQW